MEQFASYGPAIASVALWALVLMVLSGLSLKGRSADALCDCGLPKRDYADPVYRQHRAFQNALETSAPFLAATLAAILAGAGPFWVNLLAGVFLLSRIAMAVVHIGTVNQSLRSACYGIGWLCIVVTALMAAIAAL